MVCRSAGYLFNIFASISVIKPALGFLIDVSLDIRVHESRMKLNQKGVGVLVS
jgi:hypothetical protein